MPTEHRTVGEVLQNVLGRGDVCRLQFKESLSRLVVWTIHFHGDHSSQGSRVAGTVRGFFFEIFPLSFWTTFVRKY